MAYLNKFNSYRVAPSSDMLVHQPLPRSGPNYFVAADGVEAFDRALYGPYVEDFLPSGVASASSLITFVVGDKNGDTSTSNITVHVEGNVAYQSEAFVAPYNNGSSVTESFDGTEFSFVIGKASTYAAGVVDVRIVAVDDFGNSLDETISDFYSNQSAAYVDYSLQGVMTGDDIVFDVLDLDDNAVKDSIDAYVDGTWVLKGGSIFESPFDAASTISAITDGYRITLNRNSDFTVGTTHTFIILGTDTFDTDGGFDESDSFFISAEPVINITSPINGEITGKQEILYFEVTDADGRLRLDSIDAYLNTYAVFTDSDFTPAYDGALSAVTPITDGYSFVVDRTSDYVDGTQTFNVEVLDNILETTYIDSIQFGVNATAPVISSVFDGYFTSNANINVTFQVIDDYGQPLSGIDATVGGVDAVIDGVIQAAFSGGDESITPISDGYLFTLDSTSAYGGVTELSITAVDSYSNTKSEDYYFTVSYEDVDLSSTYSGNNIHVAVAGERIAVVGGGSDKLRVYHSSDFPTVNYSLEQEITLYGDIKDSGPGSTERTFIDMKEDDRIIVSLDDDDRVQILSRSGTTWSTEATLTGVTGGGFNIMVSISGNWAVATKYGELGTFLRIYEYSDSSWSLFEQIEFAGQYIVALDILSSSSLVRIAMSQSAIYGGQNKSVIYAKSGASFVHEFTHNFVSADTSAVLDIKLEQNHFIHAWRNNPGLDRLMKTFERIGSTWTEETEIEETFNPSYVWASSVGMDGYSLVLGDSLQDSYGTDSGVAYYYTTTDPQTEWTRKSVLSPTTASNAEAGYDVDIGEGIVAMVGKGDKTLYIYRVET